LKNFKIVPGGGGAKKTETDRLDRFLTTPDPVETRLLTSLRQEEGRRRRLAITAAALVAGILAGGGGAWLILRSASPAPATEAALSIPSAEEKARLLIEEGWLHFSVRDFAKAAKFHSLATELAPGLVEAWDGLGIAHIRAGQLDDAEHALRRSLAIDPEYERAHHALGDVYFFVEDYVQALEHYERAGAFRAQARVALLQGRFEDAARLLDKLVHERPDDRAVQRMAKMAHAGRLTPEERRQLGPDIPMSRAPEVMQGWRLYHEKNFEESSAAFGRALSRKPHDHSALYGRGWALIQLGDIDTARRYFERILETQPDNLFALDGLGLCLKAEGQTQAAIRVWERMLKIEPLTPHDFFPRGYKGLGLARFESGDQAGALPFLARAVVRDPLDPKLREMLDQAAEAATR
jgi:tetratricopeptide (TPR) repeat protein